MEIAGILSGILLDLCLNAASRVVIAEHPKLGMRNTLAAVCMTGADPKRESELWGMDL